MKHFVWEPAARLDLRRLDRGTAIGILHALTRYGESGDGDIKMLTDRPGLRRLRVGKCGSSSSLKHRNPFASTVLTIAAKLTERSRHSAFAAQIARS